jgi:glycosyltransferase involved in cell wall biosynthesis
MLPPLERVVGDADVVCLNVGLTLINVLARRVARDCGVPYVYNAEGALCPRRLRSRGLAKWIFRACFERRVLADAAAVQAVTHREASDLEREGVPMERIHVIPNGIDLDAARATPSGVLFRAVFPLPPGARIVLFLGRVAKFKGLDLLVRAVAACAADRPDVVLVVAGPATAEQRRALDRLAAESGLGTRLRWCGVLRGALRWSALRAASVFALTSWSEGLPNAVLEACAAGAPVLITDACNVPEVASYGAGMIVRPSVVEIADGLRAMLASSSCAARQGEAGQRMVQERFALDTVADRLSVLYRDVAARCRRTYGAPVPSTA